MGEKPPLSYIYVTDELPPRALAGSSAHRLLKARYTKSELKSTLQLMGCKPRYAHKVSEKLFLKLSCGPAVPTPADAGLEPGHGTLSESATVVTLTRDEFLDAVRKALAEYQYDQPVQLEDFEISCSIRERRSSVTVLLAGTSGTGKSTLASLLAARLGITTVLSTDSVRHMLRSFSSAAANPLLFASTYQAGEFVSDVGSSGRSDEKSRAVQGYKAQSEMVIESLDRLIGGCEARNESLICEGAHLSLNFVVRLMRTHPSIVPFLIHISNEDKHRERFAVRAKYMTLEPGANRYVAHLRTIRGIQAYLARRADRHLIPTVDNTNVDRSVAAIHATVLACLRRRAHGEALLDPASKTTKAIAAEYAQVKAATWSSKGMLEVIRRKAHPALGTISPSDQPSTSSSTPTAPLSDTGKEEGGRASDDGRSFFDVAESDMASSDAGCADEEEAGSSDDDDEHARPVSEGAIETGSVADSESEDAHSEDHFELIPKEDDPPIPP